MNFEQSMDFEQLPHNFEAEQALLGQLMLDNSKIFDVHGIVASEDFSHPTHGMIFEQITKLVDEGKTANAIILKGYFENDEAFENIGGGDNYLSELENEAPLFNSVIDYAETIADRAERRILLDIIRDAEKKLRHFDIEVSPKSIRAELSSAIEGGQKSVFVKTKKQVAEDVVKSLQMPKECFKTGLDNLDKAMAGGLYSGFTYGLCAPEKRGKTTFAHTISHNLNNAGIDHAYLALEMGSMQIEQRNLAREMGLNSMAFLAENKSEDLIRMAAEKAVTVKDHTLYLDMAGGSFTQIKSELATLVAKKKIKGFILDYWQLVTGCPPRQTKADFLYEVAQWTANFSKKHGLWCILLSQLNENGKTLDSRGLSRACDQMYTIEKCGEDTKDLWLNMTHTRYTPICSIGGNDDPKFMIDTKSGPYVRNLY